MNCKNEIQKIVCNGYEMTTLRKTFLNSHPNDICMSFNQNATRKWSQNLFFDKKIFVMVAQIRNVRQKLF